MDLIKYYVTVQYMETMTYHVHSYIGAKKPKFYLINLIFMDPRIVVRLSRNNQQDATLY
jgi:hypothetical protein